MANSFPDILITELGKFFEPLKKLGNKPELIPDYITSLGLTLPPEFDDVITISVEISNDSSDLANQSSILERLSDLIDILSDSGAAELPERLLYDLLYQYLSEYQPKVFAILHIWGVIQRDDNDIAEVRWDRLGKMLYAPHEIFQDPELYNWGGKFEASKFFARLEYLFVAFSLPGGVYQREDTISLSSGTVAAEDFRIPIFMSGVHGEPGYKEININLAELVVNPTSSGILVYPYIAGNAELNFDVGTSSELVVSAGASLDNGVGLSLLPPFNLDFITDVFNNPSDFIDFDLGLTLQRKEDADEIILFGKEGETMVSVSDLSLPIFGGMKDGEKDFGAELNIGKIKIDIKKGIGDGFINNIIPEEGIKNELGIGLGYSLAKGFYFTESTSLTFSLPVHLTIGPIELFEIGFYIEPTEEHIEFGAFTQMKVNIGPIVGVVEEMGLRFRLPYPTADDSGIPRPTVGLKPPAGIGISIDAEIIKGGGYLYFDYDKGEYAGVGQIEIKEIISVTAIAIITTKPPPGTTEPGFSLLILIAAEFQPIQLSFGFTLNGIGGLFAANRTMDLEALRAGVSNGTIDNILFPSDPVANAPQIIDQLNTVFPIEAGAFTFGVMCKIGWGTPTIISLELGLIVKIPMPIKIAILGVLEAVLPKEELAILKLKVSFIGTIDLEYRLITFDASLEGSELLGMRLYGEMAFRLRYGDDPMFLLSVGGFHPDFVPPAISLPPVLRRITLEIFPDNPRLTFTGYFAITPNTLQFGAGVDLYVKKGKFVITGFVNFNTLIQFNPFYLIIALDANLSVKWGKKELLGISFGGSVQGPSPWIVRGYAEFRVVIKIKVNVNVTIGNPENTNVPDIEVLPLLMTELGIQDNYTSVISNEVNILAESKFTSDEGGFEEEKELLILHPAGKIAFKQTKVPLNVAIEKIGSRRVSGSNEFSISFESNGAVPTTNLDDNFAPAEFFELNNAQKLSRPSFEKYDAGLELDNDFVSFSDDLEMELEYEEEIMDVRYNPRDKIYENILSGKKVIKISDTKFNFFKLNNKLHSLDTKTNTMAAQEVAKNIQLVENEVAVVYDGKISKEVSVKNYTDAYQEKELNLMKGEKEDFEIISKYEMFI